MRPFRLCALILALLGVACGGGDPAPPAEAPPLRPNVLLVTLDTLRADHLGCYGYFRDTSPRLDALAEESVLFERCAVPMATTLPSHVSMLTSTWPLEHGVLANVAHGGEAFSISPGLEPLSAVLADAGYATAAFVSAKPLRPKSGIDAGFEHFDDPGAPARRGDLTTSRALDWLRRHAALDAERPFLLWVHLFDPHDPYVAPEGWAGHFRADERLDAWLDEREFLESRALANGNEYVPREVVDAYDDLVRFTDAQVGRLLDALDELGLDERTAVAVLTDHGEGLGQHEVLFHGLLWREQVRAAWLLRVPGLAPRRVAEPVSTVDLLPTLLGRVEIPGAERLLAQASGVDALAPGFRGRPQLSQTGLRRVGLGQEIVYALTRGRWRYHWLREEGEALYDLEADPHELADVSSAHPEVVTALRAELLELVERQTERGRELGAGEVRRLDAATLKALEDLGYLGADEE